MPRPEIVANSSVDGSAYGLGLPKMNHIDSIQDLFKQSQTPKLL